MKSNFKSHSRVVILTFFLCMAFVCSSYSQDKAIDARSPSSQEPTLERTSKFLSELRKKDYSGANAPNKTPAFRWNFSDNNDAHKYVFEQKVHGKSDMGKPFESDQRKTGQDTFVKGNLYIKSQGDGTAEFVLKDAKVNMTMDTGPDAVPKTMEQEIPPMVLQGMKENGLGSSCNSPQDMLLKMIFPLPSKDLKVGESDNIPAQMPFNAMGSLLLVKGYSRITLTRYVEIDGRTCAELDVDIDISDMNIPPELKGEYNCSTKGSSLYYFDIQNRRFVSGVTALLMSFSIDAPMPKMNVPGEKAPDAPERVKMSMANDNLIRVSLIN
jgi:hypothetical protein